MYKRRIVPKAQGTRGAFWFALRVEKSLLTNLGLANCSTSILFPFDEAIFEGFEDGIAWRQT